MNLPDWFKEHVVCWYSPIKQKATNESLAADPRLLDLSGKGDHLRLNGFAYTADSGIADDGSLVFDGVGDYGIGSKGFTVEQFTVIARRKIVEAAKYCFCSKNSAPSGGGWTVFAMDAATADGTPCVSSFGYNELPDNTNSREREIQWMSRNMIHSEQWIPSSDSVDTISSPLVVGCCYYQTQLGSFFKGNLYGIMVFDITLSKEQINYIVNNLI